MDNKNDPGAPLSPEILRLTDKLAQDPKSRLFLPLGEEYIKAGMLDEAVSVLTDGLKVHLNFHTARAMLGRAYLEKGQIAEAKAEFETVISASPDNLLAHRKMAAIYKNERRIDKARVSCLAVLSLNSKDAEMTAIMHELEQMERQSQAAEAPVELSPGVSSPQAVSLEGPSEGQPQEAAAENAVAPAPINLTIPEAALAESPALPHETPSAPATSLEEKMGVLESGSDSIPASTSATDAPDEINTESLADLYMRQGYIDKGVGIYRRLLASDPDNQRIFQKLERAVELIRHPAPNPEAIPPEPVSAAKRSQEPGGEKAPDRENEKSQKIQRLQVWLDKIKKGQG